MRTSAQIRIAATLACLPLLAGSGGLHAQIPGMTGPGPAAASDRRAPPPAPQDSAREPGGGVTLLRLAKWSALVGAAGAGIYGFVQNHRADDRFRELEEFCQAEMIRCAQRAPGGEYADPEFENRYQRVRSLDRRSHTALLLSQIGVAGSVVLFLLDLGNGGPPKDIPWVPGDFEIAPADDGRLRLGVHFDVGRTTTRR